MIPMYIPKPCGENWDKMNPTHQGRHCISCTQTVTDFTSMTDEEVRQFFLLNAGKNVCGRFRASQLQQSTIVLPQNILSIKLPYWKRFLVASLLVFSTGLFACQATIQGKPASVETQIENSISTAIKDTIPVKIKLPAEPVKCEVNKKTKLSKRKKTTVYEINEAVFPTQSPEREVILLGLPVMPEEPDTIKPIKKRY